MSYEITAAQEEIARVDSLEIPETKVCSTCEGTKVVQESLYAPLEICPDCFSETEEWKDIPGYEGIYKASTLGRIKSVARVIKNSKDQSKTTSLKEKYMSLCISSQGYLWVNLHKNKKHCSKKVSRLIALTFLGYSELQVDHINGIKTDNRIVNLRYCTNWENSSYNNKKRISNTGYVGVTKCGEKFIARIQINKKSIYLGIFPNKELATEAYKKAFNELRTTKK